MNRKFKMDFHVSFLCGAVFCFVGAVFLTVAVVCAVNFESFRRNVSGSPLLFIGGFFGMGLLLLLIGVPLLVWYIRRIRRQKQLYEEGIYLSLPVSDIRLDTRVRVNGRYPFVVEAQYTDPETREIYLFRSRALMHNPSRELENRTVRVYMDRNNPRNYYMDIDAALSLDGEG